MPNQQTSPFPAGEGTRPPETTGRFLAVFDATTTARPEAMRATLSDAGLSQMASSGDYEQGAVLAADLAGEHVVLFETLGIALLPDEHAVQALAVRRNGGSKGGIVAIEPECVVRLDAEPPAAGGLSIDYLRGYRDAVSELYAKASAPGGGAPEHAGAALAFQDSATLTWGLQATRVGTSRFGGRGVRLAVLDTGFDLTHPDFSNRAISSQSFAPGITSVADIHGHGTHCVGTACGPQRPASGVARYGVAHACEIFVGKVFDNQPKPGATDGSVIAGIDWAIRNGCQVVSVSLGIPLDQKRAPYNASVTRALAAGTLIVAAAGNNANRPGLPLFDPRRPATYGFVEAPANEDAAIAVAAVDAGLQVAAFSARSSQVTGIGGAVNLAGPGVGVLSSWPVGRGSTHFMLNGTSMATPHVAGIAALWVEATGFTGALLWAKLLQSVQPLNRASVDVGAGLVQAPQ